MRITPTSALNRPLTFVLSILGLLCSSLWTAALLAHQSAQRAANVFSGSKSNNKQMNGAGLVIAELNIPSIAISVPILSGCSFLTLERGACHLQDSAPFGGLGNAAVAGHRDRDFRNLHFIQPGMNIVVADMTGRYRYTVDYTEVVSPENVEVLDIHDRPELTLITCYPFHYLGPAPKRFIVHAHLAMALQEVE